LTRNLQLSELPYSKTRGKEHGSERGALALVPPTEKAFPAFPPALFFVLDIFSQTMIQ
jgi:hypothetical protein